MMAFKQSWIWDKIKSDLMQDNFHKPQIHLPCLYIYEVIDIA